MASRISYDSSDGMLYGSESTVVMETDMKPGSSMEQSRSERVIEVDNMVVTPSPLKLRTLEMSINGVMNDAGKNEKGGGLGGSGPQSVKNGQEWICCGTKKDEEKLKSSLFKRSVKLGKSSLARTFLTIATAASNEPSRHLRDGGRGRGGGCGNGQGRGGRGMGFAVWPGQMGSDLFEDIQCP